MGTLKIDLQYFIDIFKEGSLQLTSLNSMK